MTTITREQALKIIEAADEVISALAGTNEDVHPGSDNMLRLWDDLNDRYAPPEVVRELARIALASLEAEPIGEVSEKRHGLVMDGTVDLGGKSTYRIIKGEKAMKLLPLGTKFYIAPPAPVIQADVAQAIENLKQKLVECNRYNYCADAVKGVEDACRAVMLQSGNFREIAETSTNSPVIPGEVLSAILKFARVRSDFDDFDGDRRGIGDCLDEAEQELIVTINKYASQLAAEPIAPNDVREQTAIPQVPVTPDSSVPAPGKGVTGERIRIKPHVYRELVNRLHDTAIKCAGTQQLRERISCVLGDVITPDHHKQAEKSGLERCHLETALNIKPGHTLGIIDALLVHKMARALLPLVAEKHEADHANES